MTASVVKKFTSHGSAVKRRPALLSMMVSFILSSVILVPYFINFVVPTRVAVVGIGFLALLLELTTIRAASKRRRATVAGLLIYLPTAYLIVGLLGETQADAFFLINMQRLFIACPIFLLLGYAIATSPRRRTYLICFLSVAVVAALGACVEQYVGGSILGREDELLHFSRDGNIRALFASENVLVFGALLAASVPLSGQLPPNFRLISGLVLCAGTFATGSRGPFLLAVIALLVQLRPSWVRWAAEHYKSLRASAMIGVGVLLVFSFWIWKPQAYGATGAEFSTQYRVAIYSLLPSILKDHLFGHGLGAVQPGVWLIRTELSGYRDLAQTVDSELVYAAITFGILGIAAFLIALWVSVSALRADFALAGAAVIVSVSGVALALHAWDTIGPLWFLLLGASFAIRRLPSSREPAVELNPSRGTCLSDRSYGNIKI